MAAEAHELQHFVLRFSIDQDQIGLDGSVAMIFPVAGQCMVSVTRLKRLIAGQELHDGRHLRIKRSAVLDFSLPLVVAFKLSGRLNPPHVSPP